MVLVPPTEIRYKPLDVMGLMANAPQSEVIDVFKYKILVTYNKFFQPTVTLPVGTIQYKCTVITKLLVHRITA